MVEVDFQWVLTSTGSAARIEGKTCREWTFYAETVSGTTSTYEILSARSTDSTTVGVVLGSSQALGSAETRIMQFTGPFAAVWPRVVSLSGGTIVIRAVAV